MRIRNLLLGEIRFLIKYGIIPLYIIFSIVYICILASIPTVAREITAIILVFTDPAAMGLFFMGAVVLFEKSQRVESSLAVSPVKISEYVIAKIVPLMIVGVIVGFILCTFAGMRKIPLVLLGVALASILFSLCGLFAASKISTLNGFIIAVVPFEIILCVPSILYLFEVFTSLLWILHPGVAAIRLIQGDTVFWFIDMLSILLWTGIAFVLCQKAVSKSFQEMGGAKI